MYKILIADALPESVLKQFDTFSDIQIDNKAGISKEELAEILPQYEGLVVRSRTKVTSEILAHGKNLKVIGRAGAGVDNIDSKEATRLGIIVMNTPGGNTVAAAEHTIAMIMATMRNIPAAHAAMKEERWDRKKYLGNELFGKTVGIVGLGKIGREVAKRLAAFETKLIGYDPILTRERADRLGIELVGFDELLQRAEIISIHVPKMPQTIDMLNAENLKSLRKDAVLINCARGGIVNEEALLNALEEGQLAAAAVDVFSSEPPTDWRLATHPKVVATPHLGASTEEAQSKVAEQILEQMIEYFRKGVALNAINFISVDEKLQPVIAPYFELASHLGSLFSQIRTGRLQEVSVRFYGTVADLPLDPITSNLMAGALKPSATEGEAHDVDFVNMVNSISIAREKGIEIELTRKENPLNSLNNLVACDFTTDKGVIHLAGTVYANDVYRLVEYGDYAVDADLNESMVIVENKDIPGIIGRVGTLLGESAINISHVSSGRNKVHKKAVNIFNVEGELTTALSDKLRRIPDIDTVLLAETKVEAE